MNSTERVFSEKLLPLLPSDSKVIVAFSGGCDSLALLSLSICCLGNERVIPVYVNHNIRPREELEREIALNRENCNSLGVSLIVRSLEEGKVSELARKRGGGIEDAARMLRYEILQEERQNRKASFILTAHHRQDQLETILMKLSAGSPATSFRGVSGLDESRHLIRPLLDFDRAELENYLIGKNLKWSTDSTNSDAYYRRNLIRNEALPKIQAIWNGFDSSVLNLSDQVVKELSELEIRRYMTDSLSLEAFAGKGVLQRMAILFCMWDSLFGEKELPMSLLDRILCAIERAEDCTEGSNGALFTIYRGVLFLTDPATDEICGRFECSFDPAKDQRIALPCGLYLTSSAQAGELGDEKSIRLDPDCFASDVRIRFARLGDRIRLKDGSKLVKRLLQDMGIPASLRCRVPVIEDNDGLCAVFGRIWGGKDRICVKFRTSLAPKAFPLYIVTKG